MAQGIDFNPMLARNLADEMFVKEGAYKTGQHLGDLGWYPGKFAAKGTGLLAGLLAGAPARMKDDKGLFQGGEQGRLFGRARDDMGGAYGKGKEGLSGLLASLFNKDKQMPSSPAGLTGQERKDWYDANNWAYDETIEGYEGTKPTSGTVGPAGPGPGPTTNPIDPTVAPSVMPKTVMPGINPAWYSMNPMMDPNFVPDTVDENKDDFYGPYASGDEATSPWDTSMLHQKMPFGMLIPNFLVDQSKKGSVVSRQGFIPDYLQLQQGWIPDYLQGREVWIPDWMQSKRRR